MKVENGGSFEYFYCMAKKTHLMLLWTCSVFFVNSYPEFCPNLRIDPALDNLLLRLSNAHSIPLPRSFFFQPMNVCDVLAFFDKADSLAAAGVLSSAEAFDAAQVRKRISSDYGIYKWKKGENHVNVRLALSDSNSGSFGATSGGYIRGTASPSFFANMGKVSFFAGIDVWSDFRSDSMYHATAYEPYNGPGYNLYGNGDSSHARSSDRLRGGISYTAAPFSFEAAIDQLKTGPAVYSGVTMSGQTPPEIYFRGTVDFGVLTYEQAFGQLQSDKDKAKFFYLHRLSAPLFSKRVTAAINEVIVNGSTTDEPLPDSLRKEYYGVIRGWELAYMIPFVPYVFTEHYLGDKDNKLLSFDVNVAMPQQFRWYGEFLIDDMTAPWTLFSNNWQNKWAFTVGGQYFTRLFSRDATAGLEYCRVEPWVYTHFYGGSHRYDTFNSCLGAPLGPNSDLLSLTMESRVFAHHAFGCTFTRERTNRTQRGGAEPAQTATHPVDEAPAQRRD